MSRLVHILVFKNRMYWSLIKDVNVMYLCIIIRFLKTKISILVSTSKIQFQSGYMPKYTIGDDKGDLVNVKKTVIFFE